MANNEQGLLNVPKNYLRSMKARPKYKWYKPLLAVILAAVLYLIFTGIIYIVAIIFNIPMPGLVEEPLVPGQYMDTDMTDPVQIAFTALSIGVMIPAAGIAAKITGLGGLKSLSSVSNGLRWRLIAKIALPIFALTAVFILGENLVSLALDGRLSELSNATFAPAALIAILIFFPLQCAGEEYVFRGLLAQTFGAWIPVAVIALILQGIAFGLSHGYDMATNASIVLNGILWGWLTAKTGGLEASICLHASNNVVIFLMNSVFVCTTVMAENPIGIVIADTVIMIIMTAFAYRLCKKHGYLQEYKK